MKCIVRVALWIFPVFYFLFNCCDSDPDTKLHATVDLLLLLYKLVYQHNLFRQQLDYPPSMKYEFPSIWECLKAHPACKSLLHSVAFDVCHQVALAIKTVVTEGAFVLAQVYTWVLYQLHPAAVHFPTDSTLKLLFLCQLWVLIVQVLPV